MMMNNVRARVTGLLLISVAALVVQAEGGTESPGTSTTKKVPNFTAAGLSGQPWSLYNQHDKKAIVIVFVSSECPMSNSYLPLLAELAKSYAPKGVAFAAVNANPEEKVEQIAAHAKEFSVPFPLLRDEQQVAMAALGATMNPEVFVLDGAFRVQYRGRIDDGYYAR